MIEYNFDQQAYFDNVGISKSGLDHMAKSPAHYQASLQMTRKQSPALLLGSAVHCAVLEPDEFGKRYALKDFSRTTKEGKAAYAELKDQGIEALPPDIYMQVIGMQKSVLNHPLAKDLLQNGDSEVSCFQNINGVHTKARADYLRKDGILVDLKTTQDASPLGFAKSVADFNYHRQVAWYWNLFSREIDVQDFYLIAVEKEPPYAVMVYTLDSEAIEKGQEECDKLFALYRHCLENDDWPAYPIEVQSLSLPAWRK